MSRLCISRKPGESLIFTVLGETIEVSFDAIRGKKIQISIVASHEVAIMRSSSTQIGEQEEGIQCQKN
jgi:sRNA-binding carbon storage regulator CsrA